MGQARGRRRWRPVRTVAWTLLLVAAGVIALVGVIVAAAIAIDRPQDGARRLTTRYIPALEAISESREAGSDAQDAFIEGARSADPNVRAEAIDRAQRGARRQDDAWARYLRVRGEVSEAERTLARRAEELMESLRTAGSSVVGLAPDDPARDAAIAEEIELARRTRRLLGELEERYQHIVARESDAVGDTSASARNIVLIVAGGAALLFLVPGFMILRRALRLERAIALRELEAARERRLADLETRLQRGLEMEATEEGAYDVMRDALLIVAPDHPVETLVADSSRAHFQQVLSTTDDRSFGCQVGSPGECPAASASQTRVWTDSRNLDTCPFLRHKDPSVWAVCVPVTIAGRTRGVVHAEDELERTPDHELQLAAELELVARKVGERVGVLRVLARTEQQAQADPLTGLANRRTLENRARDLLDSDAPFVVAFLDIDHFKQLNDVHGHETGDRALRLFARVLRDAVRPNDIVARYGGEEFVVVLPDCTIVEARVIAERIRARLAETLRGGTVPTFTVSVGLAAAGPGEAMSEVIERADGALLKAKQLGRDRVLAAGEILDPSGLVLEPSDEVELPPRDG